jgi:hypothetical protein
VFGETVLLKEMSLVEAEKMRLKLEKEDSGKDT